MTVERPPKGKAVQPPAAGLPPRSFGGHGSNWPAWIGLGVIFLASGTIVLAVRGFSLGFFVVVLIMCGLVAAAGGMLWPGPRVAGGDGWLMLLLGSPAAQAAGTPAPGGTAAGLGGKRSGYVTGPGSGRG